MLFVLQCVVLGSNLIQFFSLLCELLLQRDSLALEIKTVILLHMILLLKDK